ncbi:hypothetical protein Bbelb_104790 [Branchiostoma belcheri]|nr:hypothetical protein Bbelb_104790 [Branchiostoma belcheri]
MARCKDSSVSDARPTPCGVWYTPVPPGVVFQSPHTFSFSQLRTQACSGSEVERANNSGRRMGPAVATVSTVLLSLLLFIPATLPDHGDEVVETRTVIFGCDERVKLSCNRGVLLIKSVDRMPFRWTFAPGYSPRLSDIREACDNEPRCTVIPSHSSSECYGKSDKYAIRAIRTHVTTVPAVPTATNTPAGVTLAGMERTATAVRKDCSPNSCQNGVCRPSGAFYPYPRYTCRCHDGWTGDDCDRKMNPCMQDPCEHGRCVQDASRSSGYMCDCNFGWTGENCNRVNNPCGGKPCQHGNCQMVLGEPGYKCQCHPGWTGKNCNQRDFCHVKPCLHGTCENEANGFGCKCFSGWSGKRCDNDINECYTKPCRFGMCANTAGSYSCYCDRGWTGLNCTKKTSHKTTVYLTHDSRARLACLHGVLDIVTAQYRQDPTHTCQSQVCLPCNDLSLDRYATTSIQGKCNGRWHCDVIATPSFLVKGRDPCGHVKKRLEVDYRCVEAATKAVTTSGRAESIAGPSMTVHCRSTGDPPPSIIWRHGTNIITNDDNEKHTVVQKRGRSGSEAYVEASLTIADLQGDDPDNRRYVCWAGNSADKASGASSMVTVLVTGIFITVAGIGVTAFTVFYFRKHHNSPTNLHGSASPMPGRLGLRPLPSLPKPGRWSMPKGPQTAVAILDFLKPIPVTRLKKEFNMRLANDEQLFTDEYEALPKLLGEEHSQACQKNRDKNRFRNIISYDHSRVILSLLDDDPRSDYINASYIDGYNEERKYIATQGPMQNTVQDFWRMIWETGSSTILMLSNLVENCQNKVCKYWSETDTMIYGNFRVTLVGTNKMDYYIARTFQLTKDNAARREVTQFHFLAWPDFGVPDDPTDLLKFHQTVMASVPPRGRPIVVHCSAGVGRTGTFITIDAMLEMMAVEKQVDVFGFVSKMRRNRSFMVQAKAQYMFIYQALLDSYVRDEVKAGKWTWWPPSAVISQISQMAKA